MTKITFKLLANDLVFKPLWLNIFESQINSKVVTK